MEKVSPFLSIFPFASRWGACIIVVLGMGSLVRELPAAGPPGQHQEPSHGNETHGRSSLWEAPAETWKEHSIRRMIEARLKYQFGEQWESQRLSAVELADLRLEAIQSYHRYLVLRKYGQSRRCEDLSNAEIEKLEVQQEAEYAPMLARLQNIEGDGIRPPGPPGRGNRFGGRNGGRTPWQSGGNGPGGRRGPTGLDPSGWGPETGEGVRLPEPLARAILAEEMGGPAGMKSALQTYSDYLDSAAPDSRYAALALLRMGSCHQRMGQEEEARQDYLRLMREYAEEEDLVAAARARMSRFFLDIGDRPTPPGRSTRRPPPDSQR